MARIAEGLRMWLKWRLQMCSSPVRVSSSLKAAASTGSLEGFTLPTQGAGATGWVGSMGVGGAGALAAGTAEDVGAGARRVAASRSIAEVELGRPTRSLSMS